MNANRSSQRRTWRAAGVLAMLLIACPTARAASVAVGNHLLLANTPNQVITIQVAGSEQVAGEDFFAQIGDGGTFLGGSNAKPSFTNVDIIGGTIFAPNNSGAFGDPNGTPPGSNSAHPLIWVDGTITNSGSVSASGLLAMLTIDTTGLSSGQFPLLLTDVASPLGSFNTKLLDTNGGLIPLTISNGLLLVSSLPLPDYNHNTIVDAADYTLWRDTFGDGVPAGTGADGNNNGVIDDGDYTLWKSEFGYSAGGSGGVISQSQTVPEPATMVMLLLGLLAMFRVAPRENRPQNVASDVIHPAYNNQQQN